jgi:hypothetical protein
MKIEWESIYEFLDFDCEAVGEWALTELRDELVRLNVPIDTRLIGIADAFPEGGWCIHREGTVWLVYHSERGRRSGPAVFTNPFDAANFYLWSRLGDPATKTDANAIGRLPRAKP